MPKLSYTSLNNLLQEAKKIKSRRGHKWKVVLLLNVSVFIPCSVYKIKHHSTCEDRKVIFYPENHQIPTCIFQSLPHRYCAHFHE